VFAAVALRPSNATPRAVGEAAQRVGRDRLAGALQGDARPLRVHASLVARCLQLRDAVLERRVVQVGEAALDGVIQPLQPRVGFRRSLDEFGRDRSAALGPLLAPVEQASQHLLQPLRVEQPLLQVRGHKVVQLLHRHRAALAAG